MSDRRNKRCPNDYCGSTYWTKDFVWIESAEEWQWMWVCNNCRRHEPIRTRKPKLNANGRTKAQERVLEGLRELIADKPHWTLESVDWAASHFYLKSDRWYDNQIHVEIGPRGATKCKQWSTDGDREILRRNLDIYVR